MAQLIPFPRRPKKAPQVAVTADERAELRAEDRRRMAENTVALVFVVAFVLFGLWVIDGLMTYSKNVTCLQFKQRNCR